MKKELGSNRVEKIFNPFCEMSGQKLKEHQEEAFKEVLQLASESKQASLQLRSDIPELHEKSDDVYKRQIMSDLLFNRSERYKNLTEREVKKFLRPANPCEQHPGIVSIVGSRQIGKTHFLAKIFSEFKKSKRDFEYKFYVSLKYVDNSREMNVLQFLTNESNFRWFDCKSDGDFQLFKRVLERLDKEKPGKICIIFDDLERFCFANSASNMLIYDKATPSCLLINILRTWFRNSQKILLLHPWQYHQLKKIVELKLKHLVYIQGLNQKGQQMIIPKEMLGCSKLGCKLRRSCLGFVIKDHTVKECSVCKLCFDKNCHLEIQALLRVPRNCIQLVKHSALHSSSPVVAAASVLVVGLEEIFCCYSENPRICSFDRIGRFAWEHYAKNEFLFDVADLKEAKLTNEERNLFFDIWQENSNFKTGNVNDILFFFSHLFLQELLAALWLLSITTTEFNMEIEANKSLFVNGSLDVLFTFMTDVCKHYLLKSCRKSLFWKIKKENLSSLNLLVPSSKSCTSDYFSIRMRSKEQNQTHAETFRCGVVKRNSEKIYDSEYNQPPQKKLLVSI